MKDRDGDIVAIEVKETSCGMVTIQVGGRDYAQFQNARLDDVDVAKVIKWVEETAYDGAYLSDAYISPDLHLSEFANYNFPDEDDFEADSHLAIIADHIY